MDLQPQHTTLSRTDRLGLTVLGSVIAHLVVILGVSFSAPPLAKSRELVQTLEITLVNASTDEAPEDPDALAQANQDGGGESEQDRRARSPLPAAAAAATPVPPPSPRAAAAPSSPAEPDSQPRLLAATRPAAELAPPREPSPSSEPAPATEREAPEPVDARAGVPQDSDSSRTRAELTAELNRFWEEYQKRPRRKFVSARTREHKYAAYMEAWRLRVERVGNLNYPDEARERGLTGSLVLDVSLHPDGSIEDIEVVRPSGRKTLDDAAIRIVQLAAPFSPFPDSIREDTDILHITRTWQFLHGARLTSR